MPGNCFRLALLVLLAVALGGGCDRPPERFARSFDRQAFGSWRPEAEVEPPPHDGPEQVIWETTLYPDREPTPAQRQAASFLMERALAAATRNGWFDYEKGLADGYERQWRDENHYFKWEYIVDDAILDPDRPEYLMYYPTRDGGQFLAGVMFLVRDPLERGPQPGGPLTVWHYHLASHPHCFRERLVMLGHPAQDGHCPQGVLASRTPEMLHVWFVEHPEGRFATRMKLDPALLDQLLADGAAGTCGVD